MCVWRLPRAQSVGTQIFWLWIVFFAAHLCLSFFELYATLNTICILHMLHARHTEKEVAARNAVFVAVRVCPVDWD